MSRLHRRKIKIHTKTQDQAQAPPPPTGPDQRQYTPLPPEQLNKLVAPIALYPDALVAQILAASAYPTQIVEADRMARENPGLKGRDLAEEVDRQDWDPSVKSLVEFPTVLANLDRDLSWTSELGEAYQNQPDDVMQAIQYMRHKAYDAGNLRSTPQERVYEQGPNVDIQPADPDVVYVPTYNPAYVYGYPVGLWPGFYPWWGVGFGGPYISFGFGFPICAVLRLRLGMAWMGYRLGLPRWSLLRRPSLGLSAAERFITTPRLCTEIIEDSLPRVADSERADLRIAMGAGLAQPQVADMRAHLEATRGRPTASPATIAGQPLTGALKVTEPTQATGDSPAANELSLDADQARRALVVSAAAAVVSRADSLRMEAPAVRTVADTLAADMPAVDTAAVEVTVAADTAAALSVPYNRTVSAQMEGPALTSGASSTNLGGGRFWLLHQIADYPAQEQLQRIHS